MMLDTMPSIGKMVWAIGRRASSCARWLFYRFLGRALIRTVGRRTRFFGRIRFGSAESNIHVGSDCMIGHDLFLSASPGATLHIGNGCGINTGCHLVAVEHIEIGDHTLIAEFCSIRDQNHAFGDPSKPVAEQGFTGGPVKIGKNVWIGRGVFVGAGVTIGDGAVIGANSVVTRDIPERVVAAGVPARVIREIEGNRL